MRFGHWFGRLFSSNRPDDEAAEREEYGLVDRGEVELEREMRGGYARAEAAEAAEAELDSLRAPPDPDP
jgi:hypothetical protein